MSHFTDAKSFLEAAHSPERKARQAQIRRTIRRSEMIAHSLNAPALEMIGRLENSIGVAKEFRAERGLLDGYVICRSGEAAGWKKELDDANGWLPGCLAIDAKGNGWVATGGDDYSGANRWERLP